MRRRGPRRRGPGNVTRKTREQRGRNGARGNLLRGRFSAALDAVVARLNASIGFDRRLAPEDVAGSIAHARMLGEQGIIPKGDAAKIADALPSVLEDFEAGKIPEDPRLEDVHMHIESALIERIGDAGRRLHTGRSRNDQVALDLRLYLVKRAIPDLDAALGALMAALVVQARDHVETLMPGYTHLQRAQPVVLAHHLLAYVEMFDRDRGRLADARRRADVSPLGSGALAATPFGIDRKAVAKALGLSGITRNSMDAVGSRDAALEVLSAIAIAMTHLSRLSDEVILWASAEFGFVALDDAFCTGSSIMPQKKNPDVAELCRGKAGRTYGNLMTLLTVLKGLPMAYNKDLQEDKEPLFDSVDTARDCFTAMAGLMRTARFRPEPMRRALDAAFPTATDAADFLVERGVPFREAHEVVGALVAHCAAEDLVLTDLSVADLKRFHPKFDAEVLRRLDPEHSLKARDVVGGPAPRRVAAEVRRWSKRLGVDA
jgi:argininosuccinate lyase